MTDKDKKLHLLIDKTQIEETIEKIAACIQKDYDGKSPLLIAIMKGAFVFLSDLIRRLSLDLEIDFIRVSSYGCGTQSSGEVRLVHDTVLDVKGRDVIVIEDIVDTGITTQFVCNHLREKGAAKVKLCTLLNKPSRRQVDINIDYPGLDIPDKFAVGYGLDCAEKYRNLPAVYFIEEEGKS